MTLSEVNERLSCGNRAAMIDDFDAGMSYKELSIKYEIPIGTVKSRIARGRQIIKMLSDDD